jgi:hypothetical protein
MMTPLFLLHKAGEPDGLLFFQSGGNWFIRGNQINNYGGEGMQFLCGPAAVVQNDFKTLVSTFATCALKAQVGACPGPNEDHFFSFVGNVVEGGRHGQLGIHDPNEGTSGDKAYKLNLSGNTLTLYPAFGIKGDYPGAAVTDALSIFSNVSGNTLLAGGHGLRALGSCTNALILKNDFSGATHRGIAYDQPAGYAQTIAIVKNVLNQGDSFHLKLMYSDSFNYFLMRNSYRDGTNLNLNAFIDAAGCPVHFFY